MPEDSSKILFDRFEITDTLKKDQYTTVYLANHIYLGKKIILKTLSTDELADQTFLDRFKREAKILAQLDHQNIIKVLDFGTAGNNFYISFEYFQSSNLRKIIKENNLTDDDKINLCIQLFKALDAAHRQGIIHRDIKPENILLNGNLELKIADFGLALIRDDHILTHKSSIVGTPGYMSPEQIRGEELLPQTDLFSTGIVIYELFTGENPLIGKDISETINNILNFKIEKDFNKLSSLPENIKNALHELLRKNFSKRTKTALEALQYFVMQNSLKETVPPGLVKEKLNKRYFYWAAAAIVIVVAGLVISLNLFSGSVPEDKKDGIQQNTNVVSEPNEDLEDIADDEKPGPTESENKIINEPQEEKQNDVLFESPVMPSDGKLFVEVSPWADILINNRKIGTTPLDEEIELNSGKYELKLIHPEFPDYSDSIEIVQGELKNIKINFYEEVGYLDCKIFPWGEIHIDGKYSNTTPLRKPMVLMPGSYNIRITNPGYSEDIQEVVDIKAKEKVLLKYNFDDLVKSQ